MSTGNSKPTAAGADKRTKWKLPSQITNAPKLYLYNSFTRNKQQFIPKDPKRVKWYVCGPTVYDSSHMGHARAYLSFDIIRRVMEGYFGYDVQYIMNITDIDDKIIRRARQNYLLDMYLLGSMGELNTTKVAQDILSSLEYFKEKCVAETDPEKGKMFTELGLKIGEAVKTFESKLEVAEEESPDNWKELLSASKDVLSEWLDTKLGHTITDLSVFDKFSKKYEKEFLNDMALLNVQSPDILTRVSDYIPEIIEYVKRIIDNGYGYVTKDGSVYFDTIKFDRSEKHSYAKLVPEAFADNDQLLKNMRESEGELSLSNLEDKKNPTDFALWKSSKSGEPFWKSPWGEGRPGWHIECSAMSSKICGPDLDIHSGGSDLKFPHHDNEIAQVEAHYDIENWVNYFLHCGTLRIEGLKMSKSLKNFISIRSALKRYSARQLRILFLMHTWSDVLDFSSSSMERALHFEKITKEFLLLVKDLLRKYYEPHNQEGYQKFQDQELELLNDFYNIKHEINEALCDSIDTRTVIEKLKAIIAMGNAYIMSMDKTREIPNCMLIRKFAIYITRILKVFGVVSESEEIGLGTDIGKKGQRLSNSTTEELLMPYLNILADFRENVRNIARENNVTGILRECDRIRDEILPQFGIRLEDRNSTTCVKFVGKEVMMKEMEQKKELENAKKQEKMRKEQELLEKELAKQIPPCEMFKQGEEASKYSQYDDKGIPTHLHNGEEISKKQRKKLQKMYEAHNKYYEQSKKKMDNDEG